MTITLSTTLGRAWFNEAPPSKYRFVDVPVGKKELGRIVTNLAERYTKVEVAVALTRSRSWVTGHAFRVTNF
ncbi:MAG: hypothetical protein R2709_00160 [Marmoricola sp.]